MHENSADLVKDIICLANTPRHTGERYIVYGVDDAAEMAEPKVATIARSQADIIDTLRDAAFAEENWPDIQLEAVNVREHRIQVLVIRDRPEKPYYLTRKYQKGKTQLNAGTIYSRVRDSNTPSDQVATPHDIERMWRERFGLDQTPLQRARKYLTQRSGWTEVRDHTWYHSQFPEFTVAPLGEAPEPVTGGETWVRASISPDAFVQKFRISYHDTTLREIPCILYDDMRAETPAPRPTKVHGPTHNVFFSLCAGTIEFDLLQFLTGRTEEQLVEQGLDGGREGGTAPVILFRHVAERAEFTAYVEDNPPKVDHRHRETDAFDPAVKHQERNTIAFGRAVMEQLNEWRGTRNDSCQGKQGQKPRPGIDGP